DVLIKAQGIGRRSAVAEVVTAKDLEELKPKDMKDKIVVLTSVQSEMTALLEKAAGLVTVAGGLTSHGAIVVRNVRLPAIVGAQNACEILKNGDLVTIDYAQNSIYSGHANVL